jgi:hypothetical protein
LADLRQRQENGERGVNKEKRGKREDGQQTWKEIYDGLGRKTPKRETHRAELTTQAYYRGCLLLRSYKATGAPPYAFRDRGQLQGVIPRVGADKPHPRATADEMTVEICLWHCGFGLPFFMAVIQADQFLHCPPGCLVKGPGD